METSILTSVKKKLGLTEDNEQFDEDILTDINTVLNILVQMGVGPEDGFVVEDKTSKWEDFLSDDLQLLQMCKSYVCIRVKLLFDNTTMSSSLMSALKEEYQELEWRMHDYVNYQKEKEDS